MPRLRRRNKRQAVTLPGFQLEILTRGVAMRRTQDSMAFFGDRDAQRVLWEANRQSLLDWWISERPGSRPAAWWAFSAPEPRKRIAGPEGAEREAAIADMRERFPGNVLMMAKQKFGVPYTSVLGDKYESELTYLRRLALLTAWEAEQCPA
jgi:hypothetical protein